MIDLRTQPFSVVHFDQTIVQEVTQKYPEGFEPVLAFRMGDLPVEPTTEEVEARNVARDLGMNSLYTTLSLLNVADITTAITIPSLDGKRWNMSSFLCEPETDIDQLSGAINFKFLQLRGVFQGNSWRPRVLIDRFWPHLARIALVDSVES